MKLVVFGSTGQTGIEIVKQALVQGHDVTAFVRDVTKITFQNENLQIATGDVMDYITVKNAIHANEAVICALGTNSLGKTIVRSKGTANIIKAMKENNATRLVVISAMGVAESWSTLSFINKLFFATLLHSARQDHEKQEVLVKKSELDWTIVRPSGLVDTPVTESYNVGENILAKTSKISRADVAHFILKELIDNAFVNKAVTITN